MKKFYLNIVYVIVLVFAHSNLRSQTIISRPIGLCELVFEDNFDSTALNTDNWDFRKDNVYWSIQKPENATVANGYLYLNVKKENQGTPQYSGAGVVTKKGFKYGYYECRMRVPKGKGWNTSLMIKNYINEAGTAYDETFQEINAFENNSVNLTSFETNFRYHYPTFSTLGAQTTTSGNLSSAFQLVGCEVTPTSINYYFNNKMIRTIDISKYRLGDASIWLSTLAAPLGNTDTVDTNLLPSSAIVDYVRFYKQLNPVFPDTVTTDNSTIQPDPNSIQLVVDNLDSLSCLYDTKWVPSSAVPGFYGSNYYYAPASNPKHWAKFMPNIPTDNLYRVFLRWTEHTNRSGAVPVDIAHTNGLTYLYVNMKKNGGKWNYMGTYYLPKGRYGFVTVRGSSSGASIADAVMFEKVDIPTGSVYAKNERSDFFITTQSGTATIRLSEKAIPRLTIYNATGKKVYEISPNAEFEAGVHEFKIPTLPGGIYITTLHLNGRPAGSRKFVY